MDTLRCQTQRCHFPVNRGSQFFTCLAQVIFLLQAKPELGGGTEVTRQAQGRVGSNCPLPLDDSRDPTVRDTCVHRQPVLAEVHLIEKFGAEDFSGMGKMQFAHDWLLLVVVDNLDFKGVTSVPSEADTPLLIDSDTVLVGSITGKCLKAVCGRNPEVDEVPSMIEHSELVKRTLLDIAGKFPRPLLVPYLLCFRIGKTLDHPTNFALFPLRVNSGFTRNGNNSEKRAD